MALAKEVTVTLKAEDKTYKEKFLSYDPISLNEDDFFLAQMVESCKSQIKEVPEKVIIKITFEYI